MHVRRRRIRFALAGLGGVAAVVAVLLAAAGTQSSPGRPYLALGDSIGFGYIAQAGYEYGNDDNFIGFPTYVGDTLGLTPTNAACPGETTSGFVSATGDDNGCRPYRARYPLHAGYSGTQLHFAAVFLKRHPNTKLVTLQLGANDAFRLQARCSNDVTCITAGLPTLLATVRANLGTILRTIRSARYHGKIVVVDYYSPNYSDLAATAFTQQLNQAIGAAARDYKAVVADAFTAFRTAASTAGGQTCKAGLLNASPANQLTCDVHPSQSGQQLLARTVVAAYENG
jgi:lysophospholipase L1-like esterase